MAARKPKQQGFNSDTASAGKMNQRELVQRNPMTPFNPGYTAPQSASKPQPSPPTKYKGRKIVAQSDIERVKAGKGKPTIPMMTKPKPKVINRRND